MRRSGTPPPTQAHAAAAERWEFTWPGKRAAQHQAHMPSTVVAQLLPDASIHASSTSHLLLVGDNLEALRLLAREYTGQIDLIYIDPPYNTGNAFIFADRFAEAPRDPLRQPAGTDARDGFLAASGSHHARWLSMLYPRLLLARTLLRENGALCLSIGDEEVHHARLLLDEVFGEQQHRNTIAVRRHDKNLTRQFMDHGLMSLAVGFEYVLIYARGPAFVMRPIFRPASPRRRTTGYWKGFWNAADRPTMRYPVLGITPETGQWKWRAEVALAAVENYRRYLEDAGEGMSLEAYWEHTGRRLRFIRRNPAGQGRNRGVEHWVPPSTGILRTSDWTDVLASESLGALGLPFDSPKRVTLLTALIQLCAGPDACVLDFFAGSGTTAQAVLELNRADGGRRRVILGQSAEQTGDPRFPTIADITSERVRRTIARLAALPSGAPDEDLGIRVLRLVPAGR